MENRDDGVKINFFGNRRAWLLASYFGLANAGYALYDCMVAKLCADFGLERAK